MAEDSPCRRTPSTMPSSVHSMDWSVQDSVGTCSRLTTVIPRRCKASNPESRDSPMCNCTSEVRVFDAPRNDEELSHVHKPRRTLFDIGAHRLELIGPAHQFHLLDGFGEQCGARIDGKIVQHALGGADRLRTLARDFTRDLEGGRARVIADPGRKTVTEGVLRGKNPSRI